MHRKSGRASYPTPNSDFVTHHSRARAQNSLLRSKYLDEQVTWIDGEGPPIPFGVLVFANESRSESLLKSLNLPPGGEDAQVLTLNKIFRELGVSCTDFAFSFSLLIHRVTVRALADSVSRPPFEDRHPANAQHGKPWVTPWRSLFTCSSRT